MKRLGYIIITEPLFIFLIVGGLLFFFDHTLNGNDEKPEFVVTANTRAAVLEQQRNLKGGDLSAEEEEEAVDEFIDEEILLKEAYRLGLDKDQIIRTRMLRKVRRILSIEQREPTELELKQYYSVHSEKYTQPTTINFDQIFFSLGNPPPDNVIQRLNEGQGSEQLGNSNSRFPKMMREQTLEAITARFGQHVGDAFMSAKNGVWFGPIISPHGEHFMHILSTQKNRVAPYSQVEKYVRKSWIKAEQRKDNAISIGVLRNQYSIRIDGEE